MSTVSDSAWKIFILHEPSSRIINICLANKQCEFLSYNVLSLNVRNENTHNII